MSKESFKQLDEELRQHEKPGGKKKKKKSGFEKKFSKDGGRKKRMQVFASESDDIEAGLNDYEKEKNSDLMEAEKKSEQGEPIVDVEDEKVESEEEKIDKNEVKRRKNISEQELINEKKTVEKEMAVIKRTIPKIYDKDLTTSGIKKVGSTIKVDKEGKYWKVIEADDNGLTLERSVSETDSGERYTTHFEFTEREKENIQNAVNKEIDREKNKEKRKKQEQLEWEKGWISYHLEEEMGDLEIKKDMKIHVPKYNRYWNVSKIDGDVITFRRLDKRGNQEDVFHTHKHEKKVQPETVVEVQENKDKQNENIEGEFVSPEIPENVMKQMQEGIESELAPEIITERLDDDAEDLQTALEEQAETKEAFEEAMERLATETDDEEKIALRQEISQLRDALVQLQKKVEENQKQKDEELQQISDEQHQRMSQILRNIHGQKEDQFVSPEIPVTTMKQMGEQIETEDESDIDLEQTVDQVQQEAEAGEKERELESFQVGLTESLEQLQKHKNDAYNWYRDSSFWDVVSNKASYGDAMKPVYEARHRIDELKQEYESKFGNISEEDKTQKMLEIEKMLDEYYNPKTPAEKAKEEAERKKRELLSKIPEDAESFEEIYEIILSKKEPIARDGGDEMSRKHCVKMIKKYREGKMPERVLPTTDGIRAKVRQLLNLPAYPEQASVEPVPSQVEIDQTPDEKKEEQPDLAVGSTIEVEQTPYDVFEEKKYLAEQITELIKNGNTFVVGDVITVNQGAIAGDPTVEWVFRKFDDKQIELVRQQDGVEHVMIMETPKNEAEGSLVESVQQEEVDDKQEQEIPDEIEQLNEPVDLQMGSGEKALIEAETIKWQNNLETAFRHGYDLSEVMFAYFDKMPAFVKNSNFMSKYNDMMIAFGSIEGIRIDENKEFSTAEEAEAYYEENVRKAIEDVLARSVEMLEQLYRMVYKKKPIEYENEQLLKEQFELGVAEVEDFLAKFEVMGIDVKIDQEKLDRYRLG